MQTAAFQDEIDKSLAAGCTAHLTKPIRETILMAAIDQYCVTPSMRAAA
jgi:CheY-like chemotaxis protein